MEMYFLNLVVGLALLVWSWATFRDELHPQFLVTVALIVLFIVNFLTSGYEDVAIVGIPSETVPIYQSVVLGVCASIFFITLFLSKLYPLQANRTRMAVIGEFKNTRLSGSMSIYATIAWVIVMLEVLKRLYTSGWSVANAIVFSFGARGMTPWGYQGGNLGDENFVYAIVKIVLPFAGLLFAYLVAQGKGRRRVLHAFGLLLVIVLLITYGNRTPIVATLIGMMLFLVYRPISLSRRIMIVSAIALLTAFLVSAIVLFRAQGFLSAYEENQDYELTYHQDNNYYRALRALHTASSTSERLDPVSYAVAVVVNPIPRVLWSEKPALRSDYYGNYKTEWQTISFLGDLVAMFGPVAGSALAILCGVMVFLLMRESTKTLRWRGGLIVYMVLVLYAYMILRSMQNITHYAYLPAFAFAVYWLVNQSRGRGSS
jgi:oligosaccharide repeat unit polymerase